jgi:hypothetical protein
MAKSSVKTIQITPRRTPSLETMETPLNVLGIFKKDFITIIRLIHLTDLA